MNSQPCGGKSSKGTTNACNLFFAMAASVIIFRQVLLPRMDLDGVDVLCEPKLLRLSWIFSQVPSLRQLRKYVWSVCQAGKSPGSDRHLTASSKM
ncbi:hypothetical protein FJSC11DRAFT_1021 [Fischerella thermalis JSC-11]|uniref:Uncharacterized protein n=1 Tax=Fischerella thermalis JSC-11 TaxID=741277 RepID=G6FQ74_9CYAN|nr:hypothetical protein FJSC11DRAFT_1021 [Fischerella thermalis JSC-11]